MRSINYLTNEYSQQRQFQKPVWVYPVRMAMEATYYNQRGYVVGWNDRVKWRKYDKVTSEPLGVDFLSLPIPDRIFTNALDKKYQQYGNYKYHPATHMQVADGCWWGKCGFCVENGRGYKVRSVLKVLEEIEECERLGFQEIFDDSGTFPDGDWLKVFLTGAQYLNSVLGCNMRIGADADFEQMKRANFRMLLFGIESANQSTLDRLQKGIKADETIPTIKRASEAGLEPHIAVMFGYPWETQEEELETLELVHYLLRKGYAKTAQASLYRVAGVEPADRGLVPHIYDAARCPEFWINKFRDIKNWADFLYLLKGIKKGITRG